MCRFWVNNTRKSLEKNKEVVIFVDYYENTSDCRCVRPAADSPISQSVDCCYIFCGQQWAVNTPVSRVVYALISALVVRAFHVVWCKFLRSPASKRQTLLALFDFDSDCRRMSVWVHSWKSGSAVFCFVSSRLIVYQSVLSCDCEAGRKVENRGN